MRIDQTRYVAFLKNPEFYRIRYINNLVSPGTAYELQRGLCFHEILEHQHKGTPQPEIERLVREHISDEKARNVAWAMWREWSRRYDTPLILARKGPRKIAAEFEFLHHIPNSPHSIAGRIDEILEVDGRLMCGEVKTANARAQFAQKEHDWKYAPQADFEMLGAQMSGHPVEGVRVRIVIEGTPPKIWEIDALRTPDQLKVTLLNVHQVCETIEMYLANYGPEQPWPHAPFSYPCSMAGRCEYAEICGKPGVSAAGFVPRVEHLACIVEQDKKI